MAWYNDIHTSKRFRLLTVKTDVAGNRYVYLAGVASLAANDWVTYDEAGVPTRLATTNKPGAPVAIAQSANTSTTNYSWYGIEGTFTGACVDGGGNDDDTQAYASGTAGAVGNTADNDAKVEGAIYRSNDNSTSLTATFQITRPHFSHDLST